MLSSRSGWIKQIEDEWRGFRPLNDNSMLNRINIEQRNLDFFIILFDKEMIRSAGNMDPCMTINVSHFHRETVTRILADLEKNGFEATREPWSRYLNVCIRAPPTTSPNAGPK
jgi:hypothetical protein